MITLLFPLDVVAQLAEHAAAAPGHSPSFRQQEAGQAGVPSLMWVKDDGTYLMSNGEPRLREQPSGLQVVAYADGWGSGSRQDLGRTSEIGGDDFAEYLTLSEPFGDRHTFLEAIRLFHRRGYLWMFLDVPDRDQFLVGFAETSR
jgi:hypothetical protein